MIESSVSEIMYLYCDTIKQVSKISGDWDERGDQRECAAPGTARDPRRGRGGLARRLPAREQRTLAPMCRNSWASTRRSYRLGLLSKLAGWNKAHRVIVLRRAVEVIGH
ncbi:MAG: hypothetical protein WBH99_11865 [Azovibrio sp.]|uniref:hypothetical protein n=1 Tax=Azovibrio sp. TaxID=1872673 RepID=UPI003C73EED2